MRHLVVLFTNVVQTAAASVASKLDTKYSSVSFHPLQAGLLPHSG